MVTSGGRSMQETSSYEDFNGDEASDDMQKVSLFAVRGSGSSGRYRLAAGTLALLCAALLMAVIGMAVLITGKNKSMSALNVTGMTAELELLRASQERLAATQASLEQNYVHSRRDNNRLQGQLDREKDMGNRLLEQIRTLEEKKKEQDLRLKQLVGSCGRCPAEWTLWNNTCYYFPVSSGIARRGWTEARTNCINNEADLAIVDTLEKQTFIVGVLKALHDEGFSYRSGFWMGLRDIQEEGEWRWITGSPLSSGFWMDGEPNDSLGYEDCAATYPTVNPLKSWNDAPCRHPLKWICEKSATAVTSSS